MSRKPQEEQQAIGSDSFLDVTTNIVGILIILVLVVGIRVKKVATAARAAKALAAAAKVESPSSIQVEDTAKLEAASKVLEDDIHGLEREQKRVEAARQIQYAERAELALAVAAGEQEISQRRSQFVSARTQDLDLRGALASAQSELDHLNAAIALANMPESPQKLEHYPTPLSKTVLGHELHFQLKGGRVTEVPMDELVEVIKREAHTKAYKLKSIPETTEVVGPVRGFRVRYTMERVEPSLSDPASHGYAYAKLSEFVLMPTSSDLGEPVELAMQNNSEFRHVLAGADPKTTTVTLWTYSDSFPQFGKLKKLLYELGFATAARPLPPGQPIGGSPDGSKSAAQ